MELASLASFASLALFACVPQKGRAMPHKMFFPADDLDLRHAYVRKILDGMARGELPSDPTLYHLIDVKHDFSCTMMTQRGAWCDCDPTVALQGSQPLARIQYSSRDGR